MSRSAKVRLDWAGGNYDFRLAIGELDEYDDLTGCGPGFALGLLQAGVYANWKPKMVREAIRLGLIGGGLDPHQALRLVKRHVDARPISENLLTAQAILLACVVGCEEEPVPEGSGEGSDRSPFQTDASGSDDSTPPAPPSGGPAPTSETAPSGSSGTRSRAGRTRTAPPKA
jgi:hypothetical protein